MRIIVLAIVVLALAACATGRDPNYESYLDASRQAQQQQALALGAISDAAAACNGDPACVVAVAGFAALAAQKSGGSEIRPYVRQASAAERVGIALVGQIAPLASMAVAWHSSDNSRDIALGQYDFLGGVIGSVASSPALQAPSITVGGDYVPGSQHIGDDISGHVGDAIGRDAIGGDQRIGDDIGRDAIGGDRIDGSNIGTDNRIESPGPYDYGNRCTGEQCQGLPPSDPVDPEGG